VGSYHDGYLFRIIILRKRWKKMKNRILLQWVCGVFFLGILLGASPVLAQQDWEFVDDIIHDFEIPPRGIRYFHRNLGTQHRAVFNWRVTGATIIFLICDASWNGVMPPAEDQIDLMGQGWAMNNERWHPPKEGKWYFIFSNDNLDYRPLTLHFTVFKKLGSPDIIDEWSLNNTPDPSSSDYTFIIIVGGIIVALSLGYKYYPRSTPTGKTKRIGTVKQRREKKEQRRRT
jgi:hypothetical protein